MARQEAIRPWPRSEEWETPPSNVLTDHGVTNGTIFSYLHYFTFIVVLERSTERFGSLKNIYQFVRIVRIGLLPMVCNDWPKIETYSRWQ